MDAEDVLNGLARPLCVLAIAASLVLGLPFVGNAKRGARLVDDSSPRRPSPTLIRPRRVTIGNHNHFMGVLGPNARYLYYVTDEFNAYDLFVQAPVSSSGQPVFEAFGDITWPAVSPNGKELAYIRYERDARGDACRRRIRKNGKARNDREECRATDDADLQIYWRRDGSLGVLTREELHGDHVLLDGAFSRRPEQKEANVVGLAVSPDERWVAYVPLSRLRDEVGVSFSNHADADGIRIRRAYTGAEEFSYQPELPGVSGYPRFSPDGTFLYFSQFLNDTNGDGVIDGDDNGVLFRVPFDGEQEPPVFGEPRQLTNARWNCHYPSVRDEVMAITCAIDQYLHIYLLPPTGAVPADWSQDRIAAEAETVLGQWRRLLLHQHLLVGARDAAEQAKQLKVLTKIHLDLREFEAAIYYGERRSQLLASAGETDWWSDLMVFLAKHKRADRALTRGRFSEEYVDQSQSLTEAVRAVPVNDSPDAEALQQLVLSRIYSDLGDKATAAELLARVELDRVEDEMVLDFAYQQFDHFYGLLADYDTRLARLKEVALHRGSSSTQALRHSKGFIVLLQRGRPEGERLGRLVAARKTVPDDSRLARALDIEIALYQLTEENAKEIEARLVDLYRRSKNVHVRRYLVLSALRAANREEVESLQHALVELWVESAERDATQQKASTELYELVVLERAYDAFEEGDMTTAAEYFDKARSAADSLAGHVGWIESQLRMNAPDLARAYDSDDPATRRFVDAYLLARDLGSIESNSELKKVVDRVTDLLEPAIEQQPYEPLSHLLLAHALHHRGMRTGGRDDVAAAVRHYLLALDLSSRRPRVRASAHSGMALAQASLGNHRRALEDYEDRLELPMVSPAERAAILLHYARSLFHVNEPEDAVGALTEALALIQADDANGAADLKRYEPLALDRLALYQLDAGKMAASLDTHDALRESLRAWPDQQPSINEVKAEARLATAYLFADDATEALRMATRGNETLDDAAPLRPDEIDRQVRPVTHRFAYDEEQLRIMLSGLEANASRQLDDLEQSRASLLTRKAELEKRYEEKEVDEDLLELARTCLRLADVANQESNLAEAQRYLEEGLGHTEKHTELTGSEVSEIGFYLVNAYAALHFQGGADLAGYQRNLEEDLLHYYVFLSEVHNPDWETERVRLEFFLTRLRLEAGNRSEVPAARDGD